MKLAKLFSTIESPQFAGSVGVASGIQHVVSAIETHEAYQRLATAVSLDRASAVRVLHRVQTLAGIAVDSRYEHPYDIALTTYYLALVRKAPDLRGVAAELIAGAPNTWWAARVAKRSPQETQSAMATVRAAPFQAVMYDVKGRIVAPLPAAKLAGGATKGFDSTLLSKASFDLVASRAIVRATVGGAIWQPRLAQFTSAVLASTGTAVTATAKYWSSH